MPLVLLAALAGSLAIHAAVLFLPDVELSALPEIPPVLVAELQPPPPAKAKEAASKLVKTPAGKPVKTPSRPLTQTQPSSDAATPVLSQEVQPAPVVASQSAPQPEELAKPESPASGEALAGPVEPHLPSRGFIRFEVQKGGQGLVVGRAEHSWEFVDGQYRLKAVTETIGLAALLKPVRIEQESLGNLTAEGLQPERFITRRDGKETSESADFDWENHIVTLGRDGSRRQMLEGTQDFLSFYYQFSYLPQPGAATSMGVATGKKFENYRFEPVGEENVQTPAGNFRTVHVQVRTDSTTELWLAVDRQFLPVKIRYTDRKGESFVQVATELGM